MASESSTNIKLHPWKSDPEAISFSMGHRQEVLVLNYWGSSKHALLSLLLLLKLIPKLGRPSTVVEHRIKIHSSRAPSSGPSGRGRPAPGHSRPRFTYNWWAVIQVMVCCSIPHVHRFREGLSLVHFWCPPWYFAVKASHSIIRILKKKLTQIGPKIPLV